MGSGYMYTRCTSITSNTSPAAIWIRHSAGRLTARFEDTTTAEGNSKVGSPEALGPHAETPRLFAVGDMDVSAALRRNDRRDQCKRYASQ